MANWDAVLRLRFLRNGPRTILSRCEHCGPLRVQKPLYPEGPELCQCIIVHPPGGIASGDRLSLDIEAGAGTSVQLTTPGAAKWYRCATLPSSQETVLRVASGALLEWLPQGTIVFDGARASSSMRIELARDATLVAFDAVCLGRVASGERFATGSWRQRLEIVRDGALVWSERAALEAENGFVASPIGLNGLPVFGTLIATGNHPHDVLGALREVAPMDGEGAITCLSDLLIARYRGHSLADASAYFAGLWALLRPRLANRAAQPPRIWST